MAVDGERLRAPIPVPLIPRTCSFEKVALLLQVEAAKSCVVGVPDNVQPQREGFRFLY
jgi:hypothetical protein